MTRKVKGVELKTAYGKKAWLFSIEVFAVSLITMKYTTCFPFTKSILLNNMVIIIKKVCGVRA